MVEEAKRNLFVNQFSPGAKNFSVCLSMHFVLLLLLTEYLHPRQRSGPRLGALSPVGLMLVLAGFSVLTRLQLLPWSVVDF